MAISKRRVQQHYARNRLLSGCLIGQDQIRMERVPVLRPQLDLLTLTQFREAEAKRVLRMQATQISDVLAESYMLRAYEADILSHRLLPTALEEWREPSFPEFGPRTLWSLLNAMTRALAGRQITNPQAFSHLTMRLTSLLGHEIEMPDVTAATA